MYHTGFSKNVPGNDYVLTVKMPNLLLPILFRGSNGGYTNYSDNVVEGFVHRAANELMYFGF